MAAVLIVDETTHGYRKGYEDVSKLKEDVNTLIDKRVVKIEIVKNALDKGSLCECGACEKQEDAKRLNILGVLYEVKEVDVVNKTEPRRGEINYLTNEIRIDKNMPKSLKEQVLMHEIMHAVFDLLGLHELGEDEEKVQSIATALHHVFTSQTIFSSDSNNTLKDYTKIVVETDEELPKAIAEITTDYITPADGYRVRLTPKYD